MRSAMMAVESIVYGTTHAGIADPLLLVTGHYRDTDESLVMADYYKIGARTLNTGVHLATLPTALGTAAH